MGFELGRYERQHILTAFEKSASRAVIDARLGLVERLQGILLGALAITFMRFQEAGVGKKKQRLCETRGLIIVDVRFGASKNSGQANCKAKNTSNASKNNFRIDVRR